jgi:orotate phosphoribosyltransferase
MPERIALVHAQRYLPWAHRLGGRAADPAVGTPPARPAGQGRCPAAPEVAVDVLVDCSSLGDCDRQRRWRNGTAAKLLAYALGVYADMAGWEQNRDAIAAFERGGRGGGRRESGGLARPRRSPRLDKAACRPHHESIGAITREHGAMAQTPTPARSDGDKRERLRRIIKARSLLTGTEFKLASGRQSGFFFDMKKTMFHPEGASLIADVIFEAIRGDRDVGFIGGLEMGAVPIVAAVAMRSYPDRPISGFFVRKEAKDHGTKRLVDGCLDPGSKVILLEDVTTTGGSVMKAVQAVRDMGCTVERVVTIVDRLEGAAANLQKQGLELVPIFTARDFAD